MRVDMSSPVFLNYTVYFVMVVEAFIKVFCFTKVDWAPVSGFSLFSKTIGVRQLELPVGDN